MNVAEFLVAQRAFGSRAVLHARMVTPQSSNKSTGDHIKFDTIDTAANPRIALDTATAYNNAAGAASIGRISLQPGARYLVEFNPVYVVFSNNDDTATFQLYDATAGAVFGNAAAAAPINAPFGEHRITICRGVIAPTELTLVEARITYSGSRLSSIGYHTTPHFLDPYITVTQI